MTSSVPPARSSLSLNHPGSSQSQPQEGTCCFTLACSLTIRGLQHQVRLLQCPCCLFTCLQAADMSRGRKTHICANAAPYSVSTNCVCVSHLLPSPSPRFVMQVCFSVSDNSNSPAGLSSLPSTYRFVNVTYSAVGEPHDLRQLFYAL